MLKSMTAYAMAEQSDGPITVSVEIKSYNSRHLDLALRLPLGYAVLEDKVKAQVSSLLVRGRVEVRFRLQDQSESACAYEIDQNRAKAYLAAANQLKDGLNMNSELPLANLLGVPGIIQAADKSVAAETYWPLMSASLDQAMDALDRMRQKEGSYIAQDFNDRLEFLEKGLDEVETATEGVLEAYRDRVKSRVEALTKGIVELDQGRIAQEAAILADRSDISEEVVRARSHIEQFRSIMASDGPAGHKLNFLLQEFTREFNTMGAKVGQAAASHIIVDIKAEIEKLREQVQNIE
ncbi:MAG: YicC/YloC family endoribonuclease [Desulfobacteraceae bacterium]|jgi:uncharacterized protein (TIGR00255 family)